MNKLFEITTLLSWELENSEEIGEGKFEFFRVIL